MAAPSFIQEAETTWNNNSSSVTSVATASFNVLAGDILVALGMAAATTQSISVSGGSLVWTPQQSVTTAAYAYVTLVTATVDSNKAMTVTFARGTGVAGVFYGGNCLTFRGATAIGASAKTTGASGAPSLNLTTTQANSVIVVANSDYSAVDGATRTWRANAGTLTEQSYYRDATQYTIYGGYHADAGAINTYAVGLSAPSGQKYSIAAVEVKGTAAAGGRTTSNTRSMELGMRHGQQFRTGGRLVH